MFKSSEASSTVHIRCEKLQIQDHYTGRGHVIRPCSSSFPRGVALPSLAVTLTFTFMPLGEGGILLRADHL